jgi:CheY-like chemotaxis protein
VSKLVLTRSKRILVVDDNRDWADGLAAVLVDEGYSVQTAYDGSEAIVVAGTFRPHVVLMDIRMPKLTGYDAARVFSRHPKETRPMLIAITAWPGESENLQAHTTGFDHYLSKPAEAAEILQLLEKHLEPDRNGLN